MDRIAVKFHQISKKLCGHRKAISDELIAINGARGYSSYSCQRVKIIVQIFQLLLSLSTRAHTAHYPAHAMHAYMYMYRIISMQAHVACLAVEHTGSTWSAVFYN